MPCGSPGMFTQIFCENQRPSPMGPGGGGGEIGGGGGVSTVTLISVAVTTAAEVRSPARLRSDLEAAGL